MRAQQMEQGVKPRYNGHYRDSATNRCATIRIA